MWEANTPVEIWHQDEARVGQQGTLAYVWAERGTRPRVKRDLRYTWAYLFGAVCPERGVGAALVLPQVNTQMMNLHLAEISSQVTPGAHAVVVVDGAGWHQLGTKLRAPDNITLFRQPPYSPELNPQEDIWHYLRQNQLSNRVFKDYRTIVDVCCRAWNDLVAQPELITSIASRTWAKAVNA